MVPIGQHLFEFLGSAKFLMGSMVNKFLIETGHPFHMPIEDAYLVSDHNNGDSLITVELMEHFIKTFLRLRIYPCCGLIEKQDLRSMGNGPGNKDTLLLSRG